MKFRKKPIVIEAYQWFYELGESEGGKQNPTGNPMLIDAYYCDTPNGYVCIENGEWIIKGIEDEYYPCKPDIFEKTYEPIGE